jgi:hypothetical protein
MVCADVGAFKLGSLLCQEMTVFGLQSVRSSRERAQCRSRLAIGDRPYDSAELRTQLHERGSTPVIPNLASLSRQRSSIGMGYPGAPIVEIL